MKQPKPIDGYDLRTTRGKRNSRAFSTGLAVVLACLPLESSFATSPTSEKNTPPVTERRGLRVALYPYIPDSAHDNFAGLLKALKAGFERANPQVEVTLRPLNPKDPDEPFYKPDTVKAWLTATDESREDIVEVDMEMLDQLTGVATPWSEISAPPDDWHPAAASAVTLDGKIWAFPHLLCSHFVITRYPGVHDAKTIAQLASAVAATKARRLVGDFGGKWNLPSLFLDSYADSHSTLDFTAAMNMPLENAAVSDTVKAAHLCAPAENTECTKTFHEDFGLAVKEFADGHAAALLGYSEALFEILEAAPSSREAMLISSAPLGNGSHPVLFTDGLVLRKNCTGTCQKDAQAFADYLSSAEAEELLLLSRDGVSANPRYVLPASRAALNRQPVANDKFYAVLKTLIANGVSLPHKGFVSAQERMKKDIVEAISRSQAKESTLAPQEK